MAITIDNTKFSGLLNLEVTADTDYLDAISTQIIADLLPKWFGYALAKELIGSSTGAEAQKLIDGVEYTDNNGDLQYLTGLDDYLLYFVYFYYARDKESFDSTLGSKEALAENAAQSNPSRKLTQNYNQGVEFCNKMLTYISDNKDKYTDAILTTDLETINIFGI